MWRSPNELYVQYNRRITVIQMEAGTESNSKKFRKFLLFYLLFEFRLNKERNFEFRLNKERNYTCAVVTYNVPTYVPSRTR